LNAVRDVARPFHDDQAANHRLERLDTTPAILLRKMKLTETSLIVTWLTEHHGKLKTVAKGARQAKSRFAGRLDLFS
jgi:recombinational DNA repair protein (RecF pathway)